MSTSPIPDPLQIWRQAIAKLEAGGNTLANRAMNSSEFSSALHQMANLSLGMQQTFEKVLGTCLKKANLPSRTEVLQLAEALQRIESKLDGLLPVEARPKAPARPTRTRVPTERQHAQAGTPAVTAAKKRSAAKPRRRAAKG